jgi:hypothetical protein
MEENCKLLKEYSNVKESNTTISISGTELKTVKLAGEPVSSKPLDIMESLIKMAEEKGYKVTRK